MSRYYYDLHLHSCLSPCADNDNTPNNLVGMGVLAGLQIMALTDHNTCKNCPAFFEAAQKQGIIPIPGMELTTAEDIHMVCLFPTLESAMAFDREVDRHRILIKNRVEIFGEQLILNGNDELIGTEENLLSNATTVSVDDSVTLAARFDGICYPAHIDREANGLLAVLGDFPEKPAFTCAELHDSSKEANYRKLYRLDNKKIVVGSDAHYLWDIRDKERFVELNDEQYSSELVRRRLLDYLR